MLDVPGFWVRLTVDELAKALGVTVKEVRERMQRIDAQRVPLEIRPEGLLGGCLPTVNQPRGPQSTLFRQAGPAQGGRGESPPLDALAAEARRVPEAIVERSDPLYGAVVFLANPRTAERGTLCQQ